MPCFAEGIGWGEEYAVHHVALTSFLVENSLLMPSTQTQGVEHRIAILDFDADVHFIAIGCNVKDWLQSSRPFYYHDSICTTQ